jgi:hypothetical protein
MPQFHNCNVCFDSVPPISMERIGIYRICNSCISNLVDDGFIVDNKIVKPFPVVHSLVRVMSKL